jgi:general secretion pathway protein G
MRGRFGPRVRTQNGFTLIELLVVVSLIFTLSGIALIQYQSSVRRTKEAVLKQDLYRMREAIDQFYADRNKYPMSLDELVTEKYLRSVPQDPFTGSKDTWQTIMSDPDPLNPSAQPGVYDVKSGSEETALDGSRYSEWD